MEKVKLSKAELALLDALIADMQEENESTLASGSVSNQAFIGALRRVVVRSIKVTAKVTPVVARAAGVLGISASSDEGAKGLSEFIGDDGETLSVDKLIELRKSAS